MKSVLVMTLIGNDRPGLVEAVATQVAEHGGNWLESRMAHLAGQFAGILRIDIPPNQVPSLVKALQNLETQGLTIVIHPGQAQETEGKGILSKLDIVGNDRPGIVRQISHALALHGVNVEDLHTECRSAPMTGAVLFNAQANLHIPAGCNMAALRQDLERIAADLIVDINFSQV